MRGWIIALVALVILSVVVHASANETLCSDTDGGGGSNNDASAIRTKGSVKYGLSTMVDTCITSKEGVSTNASQYLKEYFCKNDQRDSVVYDCVRLGFPGCGDGECTSTGLGNITLPSPPPVKVCGNHIVDKNMSEECDPPDKICFASDGRYGVCDANCKCKLSAASKATRVAVCGDGAKDEGEECEKDADCLTADYVCSSCKCVKQLTPEEIEAMKASKGVKPSEKGGEEVKTPGLPEVDLTAKNFTEEPGIKATSGIANFFMKIYEDFWLDCWIVQLIFL